MNIIATVLLGPGALAIVQDAIRSAEAHVDSFLLVESGGGDAAISAARAVTAKPVHTARYRWAGSYGDARQFALDQARAAGATHALTLDPDERLGLLPNFRPQIEAYPEVEVWVLVDRDTSYFKERVIRCDTEVYWHGRVCEFLAGRETVGARLQGHFWELPKDEAAERRRWERGVIECQRMIDDGDDCYRWRRHRGTCLVGLGRGAEAIVEYERGLELAQHADETAWMRYLLCEQYVITERFGEARELAKTGLAEHAGFLPEFGWIVGYLEHKAGNHQNASRWAQLILNTPPDRTRTGFRSANAKRGAKQLLAALHPSQSQGWAAPMGVRIPLQGLREAMREAVASGSYEADEVRALGELLRPSDRVLELGAGIGFLATYCAKRLEDPSRVLAVEADPRMQDHILATFAANDTSPELMIAAVSGAGGPMILRRAKDFWSTRTEPAAEGDTDTVQGVALSELVASHCPTLIVCDIEGAEVTFTGTPLPGVRAVLIEVHSDEAEETVERWLGSQGFQRREVTRRIRLYERETDA